MAARRSTIRNLADLAVECLIDEVNVSPKPGLVDRRGSGAHCDMTLALMERSAESLRLAFEEMAYVSWNRRIELSLREDIGRIGRQAEAAMFEATGGVNTHKGAIWTLGLAVSAAASLQNGTCRELLSRTISHLANLTDRYAGNQETHGLRVKRLYGGCGAREEAQAGLPHVFSVGLPMLMQCRHRGDDLWMQNVNALLAIMATLDDTCVMYRTGPAGLRQVQKGAERVLCAGGIGCDAGQDAFDALEAMMVRTKASPGGAADLLAGTFFFDRVAHVI